MATILVGDIGGTNSRLLVRCEEKDLKRENFLNQNYASLEQILRVFLKNIKVDYACFALAGRIKDQTCELTNVAWKVSAVAIKSIFNITAVYVINDFEALCWSLPDLKEEDVFSLTQTLPSSSFRGCFGVCGVGTGLGVGALYNGIPIPSEGGHSDFSPKDDLEKEYHDYLTKKYGHVSKERVLSGPGIVDLYHFFVGKFKHKEILIGDDIGPQIVEKALNSQGFEFYRQIILKFCSMYGSAAGDFALTFLTTNGFYIGGGITPKILNILKNSQFVEAFQRKGIQQEWLKKVPIYAILNENAALVGLARYLRDKVEEFQLSNNH